MSVSSIPVLSPLRARTNPRFTAIVDLPTPPLAEDTAITLDTLRMARFSGNPRARLGISGRIVLPERGRPFILSYSIMK